MSRSGVPTRRGRLGALCDRHANAADTTRIRLQERVLLLPGVTSQRLTSLRGLWLCLSEHIATQPGTHVRHWFHSTLVYVRICWRNRGLRTWHAPPCAASLLVRQSVISLSSWFIVLPDDMYSVCVSKLITRTRSTVYTLLVQCILYRCIISLQCFSRSWRGFDSGFW